MSANTLPELDRAFKSYASFVADFLAGQCDPAVAGQVVSVVAGLEEALHRQARDETEIELRLTDLETELVRRLEAIERTIAEALE